MTSPPGTDTHYRGFEVDETYDRFHENGQQVSWLNYDGGMWLVSGHAEVSSVLRDDETFSSAHDLPNGSSAFTGVIAPPPSVRVVPLEIDPPAYRNYRRAIAPLLSPTEMAGHLPVIEEYTTRCLDRWIETGAMDLYSGLILLVPAMVLLYLLGLPVEDAPILAGAVHEQVDDRFDEHPGWRHLAGRIEQAIGSRPGGSGSDVITRLLAAEVDGWKIPAADISGICFALVLGGMSTTTKLGLGVFSYLGVHPAERRRVADPRYLPGALEEFLRYYSPLPFLCRTATRDVTVGGQAVRRGERIAVSFAAANRDPRVFAEPSRIDTSRAPGRHLAFGLGLHFCLGSALARTELTVMLREVLRRMPDYAIANSGYPPPGAASRRRRHLSWRDRMDRGLHITFTPGPCAGGREAGCPGTPSRP